MKRRQVNSSMAVYWNRRNSGSAIPAGCNLHIYLDLLVGISYLLVRGFLYAFLFSASGNGPNLCITEYNPAAVVGAIVQPYPGLDYSDTYRGSASTLFLCTGWDDYADVRIGRLGMLHSHSGGPFRNRCTTGSCCISGRLGCPRVSLHI